VTRDAAAWRGGLDAGDELLAIAGARVEGVTLDALLRARTAGDPVEVMVARDGKVLGRTVTLDPPRQDRVKLLVDRQAPAPAREAFVAWLGES
jgi:predicted metalloprotease with PDZ domain